jgi:tyrosinase
MDRLWDVWTRKQKALGLPILPTGSDLATFLDDPFLFYVDANGKYVGPAKAGDYVDTKVFDYDYVGGFTGGIERASVKRVAGQQVSAMKAAPGENAATIVVPNALIRRHLADDLPHPLVAEVTLRRPQGVANTREFDVLVNAPDDVKQVDAGSPYYAGTVAFFGPVMAGMDMAHDATFAVPLPKKLQAFSALHADRTELKIRLVPSSGQAPKAPPITDAVIVPVG